MVVKVDGDWYYGKRVEGDTSETAQALYKYAAEIDRIKLELEDGRWLILPVEAVRRATFIVEPNPEGPLPGEKP
jgi:hypothetical protein